MTRIIQKDKLRVEIHDTRTAMGQASAAAIEKALVDHLAEHESCSMVFAAAPSQNEVLESLIASKAIDWSRVHAFHMDEYIGLDSSAPQLFANFLKKAIFERVPFASVNYLDGEAEDPEAEAERYSQLLRDHPIDIIVMGVGENGHIAFNDPPVADFNDPQIVKKVELDMDCKNQQVNDGMFESVDEVPPTALTLTIPALMSGTQAFCIVPGPTKANAIQAMLEGPIEESCPASILRTHERAVLYLDVDAAAKLAE